MAARRRAGAAAQSTQEKREEEAVSYEPPEEVPSGTILFRYNKFQHNRNVALSLIPTIAVLCVFGGKSTMGAIVVGSLVTYLLDFIGWRDSTFVAVWVTIFTTMVTLFVASMHLFAISMLNVSLVYNMILCGASCGLWATLQFSFLQSQQPRLILVIERMLFALLPATSPVIITWALVAVNGMEVAPYYLLALMSATYGLYVLPSRSSFRMPAKSKPKNITAEMDELDELVMGRYETAVHTIAFCLLPVLFKVSIHHRHLLASKDDVADCLLLVALPLLVVLSMSYKGSMWWLGMSSSALGGVRKGLIGALVLVLVGCLELRVVMHSFAQYIKLAPPYNYLVVSGAVYLLAGIVLAHFAGYLESDRAMWVLALMGMAASTCASVALGMPYYMVPFGAAGAVFWVRFYYYRKLNDYLSFVGTSSLVIFWFIIRTFMFLDFEFDPLPMSLKHVSLVLMGVVLSSLLIPGLLVVNKAQPINGAIMCIHAAGVALLELQLHCQFKGIYPSYIVLFSSAIGVWLAHFLFHEGRLDQRSAWLLGAIYLGKAGLVFHPTPHALPSALALSLTISPIYTGVLFLSRPDAPVRPGGMSKQVAVVHMAAVAAALFFTRKTIIRTLIQGGLHDSPPDSLLLGAVLLLFPVSCAGLALFHFPTSDRLRRVFAVTLSMGAALMLVQPEMSGLHEVLRGGADDGDEGEMYRERRWAPWCLVLGALCALSLTSSTARQNWVVKASVAGVGGAAVGMYFHGAYLPASAALLVVSAMACGLAGVLVAFVPTASTVTSMPGGSGLYMQLVFTMLVGLLPVAWMLQPAMLKSVRAGVRQEALGMHRVGLLGMYAALCTVLALFIKLRVSAAHAAPASKPRPGVTARKVTINVNYLGGSESSIFVLAPILLLLSQDNGLFRKLTDEHRYFPLVLVSLAFLLLSALFPLLLREPLQRHHLLPRSSAPHPETERHPPTHPPNHKHPPTHHTAVLEKVIKAKSKETWNPKLFDEVVKAAAFSTSSRSLEMLSSIGTPSKSTSSATAEEDFDICIAYDCDANMSFAKGLELCCRTRDCRGGHLAAHLVDLSKIPGLEELESVLLKTVNLVLFCSPPSGDAFAGFWQGAGAPLMDLLEAIARGRYSCTAVLVLKDSRQPGTESAEEPPRKLLLDSLPERVRWAIEEHRIVSYHGGFFQSFLEQFFGALANMHLATTASGKKTVIPASQRLFRSDIHRGEQVTSTDLPPELRDKYEPDTCVGSGSFGTVVKAAEKPGFLKTQSWKSAKTLSSVAVKLIHARGQQFSPTQQRRMAREACLLRKVRHQNVVSSVEGDMSSTQDVFWIVTDLLTGPSVQQRITAGPLFHEKEAIEVARDMLAGLDYLHSMGITHRDVKPDNVMREFPERGPWKLIDLGIATVQEGEHFGASIAATCATKDATPTGSPVWFVPGQPESLLLWSSGD